MQRGEGLAWAPQLKSDGAEIKLRAQRPRGRHLLMGRERTSGGWTEGVIRRRLAEATERGRENIADKEARAGGPGSQKAHLVVSVGRVVLEERDALAVQAPIVPLPLLGEVLESVRSPACILLPL